MITRNMYITHTFHHRATIKKNAKAANTAEHVLLTPIYSLAAPETVTTPPEGVTVAPPVPLGK